MKITGVLWFDSRQGLEFFSLRHRIQAGSGAHLASFPRGTGALSPGVKRPGHEANNSPSPSAEVKNAWSYAFTPPYVFMVCCLVKHRNNFTFTLPLTTNLCSISVSVFLELEFGMFSYYF